MSPWKKREISLANREFMKSLTAGVSFSGNILVLLQGLTDKGIPEADKWI